MTELTRNKSNKLKRLAELTRNKSNKLKDSQNQPEIREISSKDN